MRSFRSGLSTWATAWGKAIKDFYPRYAAAGVVQGLFAVNVPYMAPIPAFGLAEHYKVLDGKTVLFRPKEWRGPRGGDAQDLNATAIVRDGASGVLTYNQPVAGVLDASGGVVASYLSNGGLLIGTSAGRFELGLLN